MKQLVVSLHDVAPATAESSRRWLELLEARSLRASLLVVPGPWRGQGLRSSAAFLSWLRRAESNGHEVVLHGWNHTRAIPPTGLRGRYGAVMARGCEEFWSLPYSAAMSKLGDGLAILRDEGFEPVGFVAPGWLLSDESLRALRTLAMRYTVTHTRVIDVATAKSERVFVTSQRPGSVVGSALALGTHGLLAALTTLSRPVRVAIHPDDLNDPVLRRTNLTLCDRATGHGYTTMTYRDLHHQNFGLEARMTRQ